MRTVPVQVDGFALDGECYLEDGVTYVPLRALLNAFGDWELRWDRSIQSAVGASPDHVLRISPASGRIETDGRVFYGKAWIQDGTTYVPLRAVTEALGGRAVWDLYLQGAAVTSPGGAYDAVELYWLSRVISAESRGEPMEGQIAVGNVVRNRVESREFPDTIPGVIFDRRGAVQFEPVENRTLFLPPAESSIEAARRVLDGESAAGDCLYFYAPALSRGVWINAHCSYALTIGGHRFYR